VEARRVGNAHGREVKRKQERERFESSTRVDAHVSGDEEAMGAFAQVMRHEAEYVIFDEYNGGAKRFHPDPGKEKPGNLQDTFVTASSPVPKGFTLIELLVVIAIIAILRCDAPCLRSLRAKARAQATLPQ